MGRRKEVLYYNDRYQGKNLTPDQCDKLDFIRSCYDKGSFFADLKSYLYDVPQQDVDLIRENGTRDVVASFPKGELTDSQTVSVAFGITAKRWLNGDSVGLGKTTVAAAIYNYLLAQARHRYNPELPLTEPPIASRGDFTGVPFRIIFLTDKEDVMLQNQDQLIRFTGEYFQAVTGKKASAGNLIDYYRNTGTLPNVIGTHTLIRQPLFQDLVSGYSEENGHPPFDMVVIDESAVLGNHKTNIYKMAQQLFANVEYKLCLNGTEFDTKLLEFYNQLDFIDPTLLPTRTAFQNEYCEMGWSSFGGYKMPTGKYHHSEDFRRKVGYRYFARTRRDLGATMTDCSAEIVKVPSNAYQRKLLKQTSMPTMAINCPWEIDRGAAMTDYYCPKLKSFADVLDTRLGYDITTDPPQVLVYCHHKAAQAGIVDLLDSYSISNRVLNGDTPSDIRKDIISDFKDGDFQILVTNVQKGLNFGQVDHIIFYEFPSVGQAIQFEGRATRQENIVGKHVYVLLSEDKELERFNSTISDRGKALDAFANTDYSMILSLLLEQTESVSIH